MNKMKWHKNKSWLVGFDADLRGKGRSRGAAALRRILARVASVCALMSLTTHLTAEGFRNSPPGAFSLGRAGGRIAQIDDSSAVQQNPANLIDLSQQQF